MNNSSFIVDLHPLDKYNQELIAQVHPQDWINPHPANKYDLVVIGAGTAGLVVAAGAAGLGIGLKVALVEKYLMGGDCLNFGCVPSKSVIRCGKVIGELLRGKDLGVTAEDVKIDFPFIMERMRRLRAEISHHDSAQRFKDLGVDVFLGQGRFLSDNSIEVANETLFYKKAVIATGARANIPSIPGIESVKVYTNESIFSLTELPRSLAILGGGPIGCELAQAFNRLGCRVTLFHKHPHLLHREDIEAAEIIQQTLIKEGVNLVLNAHISRIGENAGEKTIFYQGQNSSEYVNVSEILIAVGRTPNVEGLHLDRVGVEFDSRGVKVNDYLQTTNPNIYSAGDVCLNQKFTHTADAAARIVIKNTLFSPFGLGRYKFSDLIIPWVTYTDPEIAHVGMYPHECQRQGIKFNTIKVMMSSVDRSITDGETEGFIKVYHQQGCDRILGATIVATHGGEIISEITAAMVNGIGLNGLSKVIHSYPTQADVVKKVADSYRRTLLSPNTKKFLSFLTKLS